MVHLAGNSGIAAGARVQFVLVQAQNLTDFASPTAWGSTYMEMNNRVAFYSAMLIHGIGVVSAAGPLAYLWSLNHSAGWGEFGFALWVELPFILGGLLTWRRRNSPGACWVLASVSLVNWMIGIGSLYYEHMMMHTESQGKFLFIALPMFELLGVLVGAVLAAVVAWTRARPIGASTT